MLIGVPTILDPSIRRGSLAFAESRNPAKETIRGRGQSCTNLGALPSMMSVGQPRAMGAGSAEGHHPPTWQTGPDKIEESSAGRLEAGEGRQRHKRPVPKRLLSANHIYTIQSGDRAWRLQR